MSWTRAATVSGTRTASLFSTPFHYRLGQSRNAGILAADMGRVMQRQVCGKGLDVRIDHRSYYDGKLLGRCTKADSDAYTLLMNACGGDAARVLREYAYFSPELKAILERRRSCRRTGAGRAECSMRRKSSPWGEVQSCETLCPGCFWYLPPATAERWWQTR